MFPEFGPEYFPADLLPPFLWSDWFEECGIQGGGLCAIVAATLQAAAVAIGGCKRLEIENGRTIGPAFNLCYAVTAATRNAGAIEPVIAPLRQRIELFQTWARKHELAALTRLMGQKADELAATDRTISPDPELVRRITMECARLDAGHAPDMLLNRLTAATVERGAQKSMDRALMYLAEGVDPSDAWEALPRCDREALALQLNLSWDAAPTSAKGAQSIDLNVLWITAVSNLPALYASRELLACGRPVPMLLLTGAATPAPSPSPEAAARWDQKVGQLLDLRMLKQGGLYRFSPDAAVEFDAFVASFRQRLAGLPVDHQKHLSYLPDLARRIALISTILEGTEVKEVSPETLRSAIVLTEWFGMAHAASMSGLPAVDRKAVRLDAAARPDKKPANEVMLAKITLKAPVTRRRLWDSYNKPTRETFQPVLDALLFTGRVRWLDKKLLVPGNWGVESGSEGGLPTAPKAGVPEPGVVPR